MATNNIKTSYTADDIHVKVDEEVKRYCHEVWEDKDYLTWIEVDKGVTFKWGSGTVVCEDLAEEMRGELYNGVLVSVFRKFKMEEEQRAYEEAKKQMGQYAHILNMIVTLKFIDSSVGEPFAGHLCKCCRLVCALRAYKDKHGVELASGLHDASHRSRELLASLCAD